MSLLLPESVVVRTPLDWQAIITGRPEHTNGQPGVFYIGRLVAEAGQIIRHHRRGDADARDVALAHAGRHALAAAAHNGVFVSNALALKFPGVCYRCREPSCVCPEDSRGDTKRFEGTPDHRLAALPLNAWQELLQEMYGDANARRGFYEVSSHFMEEISEVFAAITDRSGQAYAGHFALHEEFADVVAWWLAIVNLLELRADMLLYRHYGI